MTPVKARTEFKAALSGAETKFGKRDAAWQPELAFHNDRAVTDCTKRPPKVFVVINLNPNPADPIAGSLGSKVVKIGNAIWPERRVGALNTRYYGGITDWVMLYHAKYEEAGKIEFAAHGR